MTRTEASAGEATRPEKTIEADYVIVGAGATAMAFADTLLDESPDATMVLIDRHAKPGGHWNDVYPFVTLHQPSSFYGVASTELSKGRNDQVGFNRGLGELASGAEVCSYFDEVMRHRLLPSGRVHFLPMHEYRDGVATSLLTGQRTVVSHRRKIVDGTYLNTEVPSTHPPKYEVADGVRCVPLNDLPRVQEPPAGFVVVGGGKTGIDAVLWLLEFGVAPEKITWVMPRDGWFINRETTQVGAEFFEMTMGAQAAQMEAIAEATDLADLFQRLERDQILLRLDENVEPQMFHAATVSPLELEQLRRVNDSGRIVRGQRVTRIERERIVLADGTAVNTSADHLFVNCSASAITQLEVRPVFDGDLIVPQTVRPFQPLFSASMIAYVESHYDDEATQNRLCNVIRLPDLPADWLHQQAGAMWNRGVWSQDEKLSAWLAKNRLNGFANPAEGLHRENPDDAAKFALLMRIRAAVPGAMANAPRLLASAIESD